MGMAEVRAGSACTLQASRVYFGAGAGGFKAPVTFGAGNDGTIKLTVADLTDDGLAELVAANCAGEAHHFVVSTYTIDPTTLVCTARSLPA